MLHWRLIHSAFLHTVPSGRVYSPSRWEYGPKWMNIPNRPSRHQPMRSALNGSSTAKLSPGAAAAGLGTSAASEATPAMSRRTIISSLRPFEPDTAGYSRDAKRYIGCSRGRYWNRWAALARQRPG